MWETQQQTLQHTHRALMLGCYPRPHWRETNAVTTKPPSFVLPLLWIYSRTWSLSSLPKSLVFCQSQHCGSSSKRVAYNCYFTQVQPSLKWKKNVTTTERFFPTLTGEKRTMADEGLIMMVTQFVIFQDTAVTSPEKDLKYFALKPLAIPLEWGFSIFTAFLWYKLVVKKLLSIFFYVIEWET